MMGKAHHGDTENTETARKLPEITAVTLLCWWERRGNLQFTRELEVLR
jgi:hypothetical protein